MNEFAADKNKFRQLFSNTTSRLLVGVWVFLKGSRFPLKTIMELLPLSEDSLETKLQTFSEMGLINVTTNSQGNREIEFLPAPSAELEKLIHEFFQGRKKDFDSIELKIRAILYKTILTSPH